MNFNCSIHMVASKTKPFFVDGTFFVSGLFPPIQSENQIAYNYFLNGA